ncbi:MAG: flagellar basal body L-ring protein FlgH [Burkholderiales bacterium]
MAALCGCVSTTPPTSLHQPISARPAPRPALAPADGAIYQVGLAGSHLFEDRRARTVGDTLTIVIAEKTDASKKSNTNTGRASNNAFGVTALGGLPGKTFLGSTLEASSNFSFDGKGESASNNDFTGTITVMVTEVLANGNLLVSGEKQVGINQGSEFIRLSGIVNPVHLTAANTVPSTHVADARIEYRSSGTLNENQTTGWLTRFFLNVLPF